MLRFPGWMTIFAYCAAACTSDPDTKPTDGQLPEECDRCLTDADDAGGGCGVEEQACSAEATCEEAMLCVLRFDCLASDQPAACSAEHECSVPTGPSADRLSQLEACARTTCKGVCGFR